MGGIPAFAIYRQINDHGKNMSYRGNYNKLVYDVITCATHLQLTCRTINTGLIVNLIVNCVQSTKVLFLVSFESAGRDVSNL